MRYYYADDQGQVDGPVEDGELYRALFAGDVQPRTLIAPEGGEAWAPLGAVLPFYYSYGEETHGPAVLDEIHADGMHRGELPQVVAPGETEWRSLSTVLAEAACPAPSPPMNVRIVSAGPPLPVTGVRARPASPVRRPPFPSGVRAAGVIWIGYGGLRMIVLFLGVMDYLNSERRGTGGPGSGAVVIAILGVHLLFALVFLRVGLQAYQGTMADVRGNGVASVGLGIVLMGVNFLGLRANDESLGGAFLLEIAIISTLILAGILAISQRAEYLAWKNGGRAPKPGQKGRR